MRIEGVQMQITLNKINISVQDGKRGCFFCFKLNCKIT